MPKKSLITMLLLVLLVLPLSQPPPCYCGALQVDGAFPGANAWLSHQGFQVTGGPAGRDDLTAFSQGTIIFIGEAAGNPEHAQPAQREIMAKRAAVVMAQKQVVEYLYGFAINGERRVGDGQGAVASSVAGVVRRAQVAYQEYSRENEKAIAILRIDLHGPGGFVSQLYELLGKGDLAPGLDIGGQRFVSASNLAEGIQYDGLIVDARDQEFRPALLNRIIASSGDTLYDPTLVSQKVLVQHGLAEYSTTVAKARAALETRGVLRPLLIRATGTRLAVDIEVSADDAALIYSADQTAGFLAGAKVAFVLR